MNWKNIISNKFLPDKISTGFSLPSLTGGMSRKIAVSHIESVGFTVSDMQRAIDFYTLILPFENNLRRGNLGSRTELENLSGVFGARIRVVRLRLGDEIIELTEYLTPTGRPIPITSRNNDRLFQHLAIVVSDLEQGVSNSASR